MKYKKSDNLTGINFCNIYINLITLMGFIYICYVSHWIFPNNSIGNPYTAQTNWGNTYQCCWYKPNLKPIFIIFLETQLPTNVLINSENKSSLSWQKLNVNAWSKTPLNRICNINRHFHMPLQWKYSHYSVIILFKFQSCF